MARSDRKWFAVPLAVGLVMAGLLLVVAPKGDGGRKDPGSTWAVVSYVYDGDTIEAEGLGKVRLIGIDAMDGHEVERTRSQSQLYGLSMTQVRYLAEEATNLARTTLQGRRVRLADGPDAVDVYGRRLAYVHVRATDGSEQDFNRLMLDRGLAAAYRMFEHPRRAAYLEVEREAQAARRGMWQDARVPP